MQVKPMIWSMERASSMVAWLWPDTWMVRG